MNINLKTCIFNFILSLIIIILPTSLAIFMAMSGTLAIVSVEVFLLTFLAEILGVTFIKDNYNKKRNLKIKRENELIWQKRQDAVIKYIKEKNEILERDNNMKNETKEENINLIEKENIISREEFEKRYSKIINDIIQRVYNEKQKEEDFSRVKK